MERAEGKAGAKERCHRTDCGSTHRAAQVQARRRPPLSPTPNPHLPTCAPTPAALRPEVDTRPHPNQEASCNRHLLAKARSGFAARAGLLYTIHTAGQAQAQEWAANTKRTPPHFCGVRFQFALLCFVFLWEPLVLPGFLFSILFFFLVFLFVLEREHKVRWVGR